MKGDKITCICGREFVARRNDHRACSPACRAKASDARRAERLAAAIGDKLTPKELRELARVATPEGFVGRSGFLTVGREKGKIKQGRAHARLLEFIDARGAFVPARDFRDLDLSAERRARELVELGVLETVKIEGRRGFQRTTQTATTVA